MAKPTTDAPPTAARALDILRAPEEARRAEAEAGEAKLALEARQVARQSVEWVLDGLVPYRVELDAYSANLNTWRAKQLRPGLADLEESLGAHRRHAVDQALVVGANFSDRVGRAEAEAHRLSAVLAQPLVGPPLDAALRDLAALEKQLEKQEEGLRPARRIWHGVRANTATQFANSRRDAAAVEDWMRVEEGTS